MDPAELGRRVVIARVYAGHIKRETFLPLARERGITGRQLGTIENGERKRGLNVKEVEALSELTGVPEQFFTDPAYDLFSEPVAASDLFDQLDRIEEATRMIPRGMTYLEGLVSEDILDKMRGGGGKP